MEQFSGPANLKENEELAKETVYIPGVTRALEKLATITSHYSDGALKKARLMQLPG